MFKKHNQWRHARAGTSQMVQNTMFKLNSYKACIEPTNTPESSHDTIDSTWKRRISLREWGEDIRCLEVVNNQKENCSGGEKKRFLEWRQLCPTEPCRCLDGSPSKSKHHVSIKWDSFLSKTKGLSHSFSLYFPASILQTEESNQAHNPREVR